MCTILKPFLKNTSVTMASINQDILKLLVMERKEKEISNKFHFCKKITTNHLDD